MKRIWFVLLIALAGCSGVRGAGDVKTETYTLPFSIEDGVTGQTVEIAAVSESIYVEPLVDGENLFAASVSYLGTISFDSAIAAQTSIRLRETDQGSYSGDPLRWDVQLKPTIPTALTVSSVAGEISVNGAALNLSSLNVNATAGNLTISAPLTDQAVPLTLNTASGNISITVADGGYANLARAYTASGTVALTVQSGGRADGAISVSSGSVAVNAERGARLDLSRIENTAGDVTLTFAGAARANATIVVTTGNVVIDIPDDAPLRLTINNISAGNTNLPFELGRVSGSGDTGTWETTTYAGSSQQITLVVESVAAGTVTVR